MSVVAKASTKTQQRSQFVVEAVKFGNPFGGGAAAPAKGTKKAPARKAKLPAKKGTSRAVKKAPAPASGGKVVKGWGGGEAFYNNGKWYGADRSLFLPGGLLTSEDIPAYLDGELAGDYGYDPLGLGADGGAEKYRAFELIHARWAMLGFVGCLVPEGASLFGTQDVPGAVWFNTGAAMLDGGLLEYYGVGIPLPLIVVVAIEVGLMAAVEKYRKDNDGPAGTDLDPLYPGGKYFDPLGLADDPDAFAELKVKEIKNGRLAMTAMLGFFVQAAVTGKGPFENWAGHVADPFGYNLTTVVGRDFGERAAYL